MEKFTFFWDGVFSNWYQSKFTCAMLKNDGDYAPKEYLCVEQYMMAHKALLFDDMESYEKIMQSTHPREQKALGRKVKGFDKEKWEEVARGIVYTGCYAKFDQNPELKELLMKTEGTTLVEASPYDKIWGIGLAEDNPLAKSRDTWKGLNWLGEVLTKVREDMKEDKV